MSAQGVAALFARPPSPGRVKTRLATDVGAEVAAEVARALLADAVEAVGRAPSWRPVWACTEAATPSDWGLPEALPVWLQGGGDLSARVTRILQRGVSTAGAAVALGPDTLGLDVDGLEAAAAAVRAGRPCLGRAEDGGFWALGLAADPGDLLDGVTWSAPTTGDEVWARLVARWPDAVALAPRRDLDDVRDLDHLLATPALWSTSPRVLAAGRACGRGA